MISLKRSPSLIINCVLMFFALIGAGLVIRGLISLVNAAAPGIDSFSIEASEYAYQTFESLKNGTKPPDLTLTVQTQIGFDYVAGARIEIPLNFNPNSLGLSAFNNPASRPAFFNIKTLPSIAEYPFISRIDTTDPTKLVFHLKSAAEYSDIVGLKSFPIIFSFNTNYTNNIPISTVLWKPQATIYVDTGNTVATAPDVVSSVKNTISVASSRFLPNDNRMPSDSGLVVRLVCSNPAWYESRLDSSYNNHCFIDVPAGSNVQGLGNYTFSGVVVDGGASYDRYIKRIDDTSSTWNVWYFAGDVNSTANQYDITVLLPAGFNAGRSFLIRWGANFKKMNAAPTTRIGTLDYTVINRPAWDLRLMNTHSTGNGIVPVSGINVNDTSLAPVSAFGYDSYMHNGTTRNQGAGNITGVRADITQSTAGAPKLNYASVWLYALRDSSNSANLPAWSRYRAEFVMRNALTNATRIDGTQTFAPTAAGGGETGVQLSLPAPRTNEYIETIRITPMGTDGASTGVLPPRNAFSVYWQHGAWPTRWWPNNTQIPDTNSSVDVNWTLYYNDSANAQKTQNGMMQRAYYSNQSAAKAQLVSSEAPAGVLAGNTVNYLLNGINDANTTTGNWVNPRMVLRVPSFLYLANPGSLRLRDAAGNVVGSATVTATQIANRDGYKYFRIQVTNYSAPRVAGTATPAFSIPLQFEIESSATPGTYVIDPAVVSSNTPSTFYTSGAIGVNQALPSGSTRADYGFSSTDNYSVSALASSPLQVLAVPRLTAEAAIKSIATGGTFVVDRVAPALHNETVQMKLIVRNESTTAFTNIRLYDILPASGDALGSTGRADFVSIEDIQAQGVKLNNAVVRYASPSDSLPVYGGHGDNNLNLQTSTFANGWSTSNLGTNTRAFWADFGDLVLEPGETIEIILNFLTPPSGNQAMLNQFRYSAKPLGGADVSLNQNSPVQGFTTETIALLFEKNLPEYATEDPISMPENIYGSFVAGVSDALTISDIAPSLKHYVFDGWNTAPDGSGTQYKWGETVRFTAPQLVQLFAQWSPVDYNITFEINGAEEKIPDQKVKYAETAIEPEEPTKPGYTFEGWYTDAILTEPFDFETLIDKDLILYAKWTENPPPPVDPPLVPGTGLTILGTASVALAVLIPAVGIVVAIRRWQKRRSVV